MVDVDTTRPTSRSREGGGGPSEGGRPVFRRIFATVAIVQVVLIVVQPVLAGMSLDGSTSALDWHYHNGMTIMGVAFVQLIVALLWWRPGGGPVKAVAWSVALTVLTVSQFLIGDAGNLAVHLPLGIITMFGAMGVSAMPFRTSRNVEE